MREEPHRLVFVDETSVKTNMTRLRGRAPVGQRLRMDAPFGRWRIQTFVAGLTADALIAPWVIEGAMGLSGILCGGRFHLVDLEALAEGDGELRPGLDPFPRRPLPVRGRSVQHKV